MRRIQHIFSLTGFLLAGFVLLRVPHDIVMLEYSGEPFYLRVLTDPEAQARGFQLVEDISPNEGLVFVLPKGRRVDFWMRNVVQKLDIVFLDHSGVVVKLIEGAPNTSTHILSPDGAVCAVELPKGVLPQMNLVEGKRLSGELFSKFQETYRRYEVGGPRLGMSY